MSKMIDAISAYITDHVRREVADLNVGGGELRAVFNGPPLDLIRPVYDGITAGGGISATLGGGEAVVVPVVLQVPGVQRGSANPAIGASGLCDVNHLLNLRNATSCPRYLALVPPGSPSSLSQTSTRSDFGLKAHNNSGSASIDDWWNDGYIQHLVDGAIRQQRTLDEQQLSSARTLIRHAVRAANDVDEHDTSRGSSWFVLSRCWEAGSHPSGYANWLSLACGFPATKDVRLDADEQVWVVKQIAERIEELSIRGAINSFLPRAESDLEREALECFASHLIGRFETLTVLCRALPAYYAPSSSTALDPPPRWWLTLTTDCWKRLLDTGDRPPIGSISIECTNPLFPRPNGLPPVVRSEVRLLIKHTEETAGKTITITRTPAGSTVCQWQITLTSDQEVIDDAPPPHRSPIRYTASVNGLKPATCRAVSLATWIPGIVLTSRTASKGELPRTPRGRDGKSASFQSTMSLHGEGRHYIDVYLGPDISLEPTIVGVDESAADAPSTEYKAGKVTDSEYGFEIEATSECRFDLAIRRAMGGAKETIRLLVSCDDISPRQCQSEYERLLQLNGRKGKQGAIPDVQINRQVRSADLQTWILAPDQVSNSFYPLVLGPDYASDWRQRDWGSQVDTIMSKGRFLHDPRPRLDLMQPPAAYRDARTRIASRIRGEDQNGLVEAARLGEWLSTDAEFAAEVETYIRAFNDWLDSEPDVAAWSDLVVVTKFESDGSTLMQEPYAIVMSPLHPLRLAWHCIAQRAMFLTLRKQPCPAASVIDPDIVPDSIALAMRTASGGIKKLRFFSVECSSDYWSILWNTSRFDGLAILSGVAPFDIDFGVLVGGIASGFSVSQVHRAMSDMSEMLSAQPTLNVLLTSAAGQNSACNEGVLSWCRAKLVSDSSDETLDPGLAPDSVQIIDERDASVRPQDAEISNIAEDTANCVTWYARAREGMTPDIAIIAQLETTNASTELTRIGSSISAGGLLRARVRQQLGSGNGAFLLETRTGAHGPTSGDVLADNVATTMLRLENLDDRCAYTFAPSVPTIQRALSRANFAAVSSSAIDPACFLGGWLEDSYLWDYDLPSYSSRSGDSNGYYLLSKIKDIDREGLGDVLHRLPGCKTIEAPTINNLILEVARRGIPTVRGLASGNSGASGDLGLFVASRLLQDEFRSAENTSPSLLPVWREDAEIGDIVLIVPVDPFRGYMEDLGRALSLGSTSRPDLVVAWIKFANNDMRCKITPVEVKFRGTPDPMSVSARREALSQARAMSALFGALADKATDIDAPVWKVAFQHFLLCILNFGFRVYSQQLAVSKRGSSTWAERHARVSSALLCDELAVEVDPTGRLIVIDASTASQCSDLDGDQFIETLALSHSDASLVVRNEGATVYEAMRAKVGAWGFAPSESRRHNDSPPPMHDTADTHRKAPSVPIVEAPIQNSVPGGEIDSLPISDPTIVESVITQDSSLNAAGIRLVVGSTVDTLQPHTDLSFPRFFV